jgi:large subunit ribosomal protein L18
MGKLSPFQRRQARVRRDLRRAAIKNGRPRLSVYRSGRHIYAQVIDDTQGHTLVAASSLDKDIQGSGASGADIASATKVGSLVAERAKQAGIDQVVFDRGGYLYHGRVKALADAAREAGLQF